MKAIVKILKLIIFCSFLTFGYAGMVQAKGSIQDVVVQVKDKLRPLDLGQPSRSTELEKKYYQYYGLDFNNTDHYFGLIRSTSYNLATHVFQIRGEALGTVIVLHGYYDHSGYMKNLISKLLIEGFNIVSFDMPGHGLSDGVQATINDFNEYASALRDVYDVVSTKLPGPYHFVGHSTGATALFGLWMRGEVGIFDRTFLVAPLIRSKLYNMARLGNILSCGRIKYVRRVFRNNSGDKEFLKFIKKDPLQYNKLPLDWFRALIRFVDRFKEYDFSDTSPYVLQGNKDGTIEWKKNIKLIKNKFPGATIDIVKGADHHLLNETKKYRSYVIGKIIEEIKLIGL
jgi:alpha-beta hydrolase superfamily lysophospholipase